MFYPIITALGQESLRLLPKKYSTPKYLNKLIQ